jgi:aryl-alcohol dehydrogenase-like predicted oxidoreductase
MSMNTKNDIPRLVLDLSRPNPAEEAPRWTDLLEQGAEAFILAPHTLERLLTKDTMSAGEARFIGLRLEPTTAVDEQVTRCLELGGADRLQLLLMSARDATSSNALAPALSLRDRGRLQAIAITTTNPDEARFAIEMSDIDAVEHPFSLLDQRARSALFDIANDNGTALLATAPLCGDLLHAGAAPSSPELLQARERVERWSRRNRFDLTTGALRFCFSHPEISAVVLDRLDNATVALALDAARAPALPRHKLSDAFPLALDPPPSSIL